MDRSSVLQAREWTNERIRSKCGKADNESRSSKLNQRPPMIPHQHNDIYYSLPKLNQPRTSGSTKSSYSWIQFWMLFIFFFFLAIAIFSTIDSKTLMKHDSGSVKKSSVENSKLTILPKKEQQKNIMEVFQKQYSKMPWITKKDVLEMVRNALSVYNADKTGMTDYAAEAGGGKIVEARVNDENLLEISASYLRFPFDQKYSSATKVIQLDSSPGNCWGFKGSQSQLIIKLSQTITPTAFSLEHSHVSLSLIDDNDNAPKDFTVMGLASPNDTKGKKLGTYTYKREGLPVQTFLIQDYEDYPFRFIKLHICSNHGNEYFTCVYRFRVHGKLYSATPN